VPADCRCGSRGADARAADAGEADAGEVQSSKLKGRDKVHRRRAIEAGLKVLGVGTSFFRRFFPFGFPSLPSCLRAFVPSCLRAFAGQKTTSDFAVSREGREGDEEEKPSEKVFRQFFAP
jgi:hypothetical protein